MAMFAVSRRLSISGGSAIGALRYATTTVLKPLPTSFREERDTFGPILVPSDKFVSQTVLIGFGSKTVTSLLFFLWVLFLNRKSLVFSGCGGHRLKDRCRTLTLEVTVKECLNQLFVPLVFLRDALPRFFFFNLILLPFLC